jgi:hypothetical protein
MSPKQLFIAVPAALFVFGSGAANAGQTINEAGAIVCVNDKWDEKEVRRAISLSTMQAAASTSLMIPARRRPPRSA